MQKLLDLLDTCGRRLHVLLFKMTADRDAAEELLQELFLRVLHSPGFPAAPNPEGYLFRAAINVAFDWRKRNRRTPGATQLDDVAATDTVTPLDRLVQHEHVEHLLTAMAQLSEQDREVISLRFLQDESYDWIAARLESTPHVIRSRCSKAVARLRTLMKTNEIPRTDRRIEHE